MSSAQQPQDPTAAPEQPSTEQPAQPAPAAQPTPAQDGAEGQAQPEDEGGEAPATEEQPAEEQPAEDDQPQVVSGPMTVSLEMMLFEAGMIANSLSSKAVGAELADKLFAAEQEAEGKGQASLTFEFSPFEAGMALNAMSRSQDGTMDKLEELLHEGLVDLMNRLGVQPLDNDQGGGTL